MNKNHLLFTFFKFPSFERRLLQQWQTFIFICRRAVKSSCREHSVSFIYNGLKIVWTSAKNYPTNRLPYTCCHLFSGEHTTWSCHSMELLWPSPMACTLTNILSIFIWKDLQFPYYILFSHILVWKVRNDIMLWLSLNQHLPDEYFPVGMNQL